MDRKLLILVAPPYANNRLHIAHIRSTYLPADILARYSRMSGREVYLVGGADEYGLPVVMEADKTKREPRDVVNEFYASHLHDFSKLGISFELFTRTTSPNHPRTVHGFYEAAKRAGRLYQKTVLVPYCSHCNRLLFDRYLQAKCPRCKAEADGDHCNACGLHIEEGQFEDPRCALCGARPERVPDEHVFFRIADRLEYLKQEVLAKPDMPDEVKREVAGIEHFMDWDITRVQPWGVQFPDLPGKAFYMIFEAFPNYVTFTTDLGERLGRADLMRELWGEDSSFQHVYFMGRDLIYLHISIWPLMLETMKMRRPDVLHGGGLLNYGGRKMSKSKGWMISVRDFLDSFDPDLLRYYLSRFSPHKSDAEFNWDEFEDIIQKDFRGLAEHFAAATKVNGGPQKALAPRELEELFDKVGQSIDACRFDEALGYIVSFYAGAPRSPLTPADAGRLLANLAVLLAPFVPGTAERLWSVTELPGEVSRQAWRPVLGEVLPLGAGHLEAIRGAFPRLDEGAMAGFLEKLSKVQFESKTCFLAGQAASMRT